MKTDSRSPNYSVWTQSRPNLCLLVNHSTPAAAKQRSTCPLFYFVSEAQKFRNFFFFCFFLFLNISWGHFSNLQISAVLTIFLHWFDSLRLICDMFKFFPFFSRFFKNSSFLTIFSTRPDLFSQIWFEIIFQNFIPFPFFRIFPGFFPVFPFFSGFFQIFQISYL